MTEPALAKNGPAAMRRAARWTCVEGMPHRCMFLAGVFVFQRLLAVALGQVVMAGIDVITVGTENTPELRMKVPARSPLQRRASSRGVLPMAYRQSQPRPFGTQTFFSLAKNGSAGCRCAFNNGNPTVRWGRSLSVGQ